MRAKYTETAKNKFRTSPVTGWWPVSVSCQKQSEKPGTAAELVTGVFSPMISKGPSVVA